MGIGIAAGAIAALAARQKIEPREVEAKRVQDVVFATDLEKDFSKT
jgi:hypothetical protein